ncbi:MAG: hypothetical protein KIT22_07600 [Verrucomicrobiae bacterium]|nr:hypothetical protein [Verrucomicrobiae bacterium]
MNLFVFLNRLLRAAVIGLVLLAVWMLWDRRGWARPWVDLYVVWEEAGYRAPDPPALTPVTVVKVLEENVIQVRDTNRVVWNVGLAGLGGVLTDGVSPQWRRFATETRTNLAAQLTGKSLQLAFTETAANRTARGFFYWSTNRESLALELVSSGRLRWLEESTRMLPLREQVMLKGADRRAREDQAGLWKGIPVATISN